MGFSEKFSKLFSEYRDDREMEKWVMSLGPLVVAFVFFLIFMMPLEIENKDIILVGAGTAAFAGLEGYWVVRGWRRNDGMTVIQGIFGIIAAFAVAWLYFAMTRNLM